ncbi:hypothetical protein KVR01_002333 [Diaporthe batatas]|uniref:uncharacterized protein n=1 Tax=Diaporthe batatas TaxID=748121 RepID=UPI001D0437E5|nr:uncharacterized protein KVR01_002333 [Diaporthe batatas]KAG8166644.1 hypothetical protein KVR01_002333 [Diaporthe batatas]
MSGSVDSEVLEAARVLCMLARGDGQPSQHPADNEYEKSTLGQSPTSVIQAPAPAPVIKALSRPLRSPEFAHYTSIAEQSSPAQGAVTNGNPNDPYTLRSFCLQALLATPEEGWMCLGEIFGYLCDRRPGLEALEGKKDDVLSNLSHTLNRMMDAGLVEKQVKLGKVHRWRISAQNRRWAVSLAREKKPISLPQSLQRGGSGAGDAPSAAASPRAASPPGSAPPKPAPILMQTRSAARAAAAATKTRSNQSIDPSRQAGRKTPAGKHLRGRFVPE